MGKSCNGRPSGDSVRCRRRGKRYNAAPPDTEKQRYIYKANGMADSFQGRSYRTLYSRGFASVYFSGGGSELARTAAFMTLVLIQLVHSFECRSERKNLFELGIRGNYFLLISDAISFLLMLCVVYVPFLQGIFRTVPLGFTEWFMIMGFTAIGPVADWASEIFWDRKK